MKLVKIYRMTYPTQVIRLDFQLLELLKEFLHMQNNFSKKLCRETSKKQITNKGERKNLPRNEQQAREREKRNK